MALQPPSQLQQIGTTLGGWGAGLQGNLPQFNAVQDQRMRTQMQQEQMQQEIEAQRAKSGFMAANAALNLAKKGRFAEAESIGIQRLQALKMFPDADPSDTQRMTLLARAASNGEEEAGKLLIEELESTVEVGRAYGVLDTPEAERIPKSEITGDQVVEYDPETEQYVARSIEDFRPEAETDVGRLFQELRYGNIDEDAFLNEMDKLEDDKFATTIDENGMPVQVNLRTGEERASPRAQNFQELLDAQESREELSREAAAAGARLEGMMSTTDRAISAIDAILNHPGLASATGPIGSRLSPSRYLGEGRDAKALIDSLKNRVFVETLQSMREMSKTGGAVGNVSDKEGERLENAIVALDTAQSDEQFAEQLTLLKDIFEESIYNLENAYRSQYFDEADTVSEAEGILGGN